MKKVMDKMHIEEMTVCYGMTETSPVSFQVGFEVAVYAQSQAEKPTTLQCFVAEAWVAAIVPQSHRDDPLERRVSTVGQIHPHVHAKVVNPDTEETLPVGRHEE